MALIRDQNIILFEKRVFFPQFIMMREIGILWLLVLKISCMSGEVKFNQSCGKNLSRRSSQISNYISRCRYNGVLFSMALYLFR